MINTKNSGESSRKIKNQILLKLLQVVSVTNNNSNVEIETQREGCFRSPQKRNNIPEFEVASHATAKI